MKSKKLAVGVGLAGGALLAVWLLSGSRRERAKNFISKQLSRSKNRAKAGILDRETEALYI
ncbi:MAG: hypothetical protein HC811_00385 [Flammeovirgaceae bacterium]|nr:hypothetical protein [Flammeovirgaceae bacterium]